MFIDSFSVGLDDLKGSDMTVANVLRILDREGRFSCFEASANPRIAAMMTNILRGPYVEEHTPDRYKGKIEPDGRGPDCDTYPWTYVKITDTGRVAMLGVGGVRNSNPE